MIEEIEIPKASLPARLADIEAKGGVVTRMSVELNTYVLTVRWDDQPELAGCAGETCQCDLCRQQRFDQGLESLLRATEKDFCDDSQPTGDDYGPPRHSPR
jgi:hypothetical protein